MNAVLRAMLLFTLGATFGLALAGPYWDIVNGGRTTAPQGGTTSTMTQAALQARCDEMFRQMDSRPAIGRSPRDHAAGKD